MIDEDGNVTSIGSALKPLSIDIQTVITNVANLQVKANEKGISLDFESVLIQLEAHKTSAETVEALG